MDPLQLLQALGFQPAPHSAAGTQPTIPMQVQYDPWAQALAGVVDPRQLGQAPQAVPPVPQAPSVPPPSPPPELPAPAPPPPPSLPPGAVPMAAVPVVPTAAGGLAPAGQATVPMPAAVAAPSVAVPIPPLNPGPDETGSIDPLALLGLLTEPSSADVPSGAARPAGPSGPSGQPPRGGGPAPMAGGPPPAPPAAAAPTLATSPEPAGRGGTTTALRDPASRERLFQILSVMGAMLAKPIPPGGNVMGNVANALGAAVLYQDAMSRGEQERDDKRVAQEQANRRLGQQDAALGVDRQRAATTAALGQGRLALDAQELAAKIPLIASQTDRARIEAEKARIDLIPDLERKAIETQRLKQQVELLVAQTDKARADNAPETRRTLAIQKILTDSGVFPKDDPSAPVDWGRANAALSIHARGLGLQNLDGSQTGRFRAEYDKLIQSGRDPATAEGMINSFLLQKGFLPQRWQAAPTRR